MSNEKILIVEDEGIVILHIRKALGNLGYIVAGIANRGDDAIVKATEIRPDLVLMDIVLKGTVDGIDAAAKIQTILNIPVIYLTAHADESTLQRAKVTEPFGYIVKPFGERDLQIAIEFALYKSRMEAERNLLIRERNKTEKELKLFRNLIDGSSDAITVIDPGTGRFLIVNDKACADLGYDRKQLLTLRTLDIEAQFPDQAAWDDHVSKVKSRGALVLEGMNRRKDGTLFPVEVNVTYMALGETNYMVAVVRDITERKGTDAALREREKQLAESQRIAHIGSWEHNLTTGQVFWSDELFRLYGLDPKTDRVDFKMFFDMVHPDDQPVLKEAIDETVRLQKPCNVDFRLILKDGSTRIFHAKGELIHDDTGIQSILSGTSQDITDRKQAEEKLIYIMKAVESTSDAIGMSDSLGHHFYQNKAFTDLYGYATAKELELAGGGAATVKDPEVAKEMYDNIMHGKSWAGELEVVTKSGRVFPAFERADAIKDSDGNIIGLIGIITDLTERKRAEEARQQSEERLRLAMTGANDGLWDWNLQTDEVYYSPRWKSMLGYGTEELGHNLDTWKRLVHPDDRERTLAAVSDLLEGRADKFEVEYRMRHKDDHYLSILSRAFLSHSTDGKVSRLVGTHVDITARKEAEEKIRQSEEFIRNIMDTVDEGFIVIDRDFCILTANKAYCSQVGEPCNSVIGRHCYEISHKALRPCYEMGEECAVLHVFETGEPHTALHKHPDAKGSILYVETKAFPIKDSSGAVTSVIETVNNITEKHLLEEEQLKTQKLEAIGTLAGGIAHDFNNLLQGVFGYISMAKMTLDQKERSLTMLEQAEKALHMSVGLTTQLLTFSKGGKPVKNKIQMKSVIENSVRFALSGSRVDFRIKLDEDLWTVEADEGQIGQVIQNLVLNADQAMPMGGTITIMAGNVSSRQKELPVVLQQGNYVVISVKDSGIGIPGQYLPKIFDPYFTTKDKGSGLGLATSYSIIKNHGGLIDVKSKLGEGTTFFVYLPAFEAVETLPVTASEDVQALRKGRILLMDDEDIIRNIAGIMIRSLGHEVEMVENGEKAIARYRESMNTGNRFDIVIMDLTVRGGMGGEKAIKELLAIDPDIKAIVSSGYSEDVTISEYATYGFKACLSKPYDIASLNKILNSLLH